MNCCSLLNRFHNPTTTNTVVDDPVEWYENRPSKTGKWFIVHKSIVNEILNGQQQQHQQQPIELWDNFFHLHPVGVEYCKEFVALSFTDEDIETYHDRIRLASYRWEDIKGVSAAGEGDKNGKGGRTYYNAPSNYVWFLQWLEQEKLIGWMDFMANIVVNVSGGETIAYMGTLYADHRTVSHWMLDLMRLEAALKRGWIFQETAFGAFDKKAISNFIDELRGWALSSLLEVSREKKLSEEERMSYCLKFVQHAEQLSKLLDRRGYYALAQNTTFMSDRQYNYYIALDMYGMTTNVAKLVVDRVLGENEGNTDTEFFMEINNHVSKGYNNGYTAMFHLCDLFTDTNESNFNVMKDTLIALLSNKTWTQAATTDELFEKIGDPLLAAFSCLEVTYETDRDNALTQVAKAIVSSEYNDEADHKSFCLGVWKGAADICLQTSGLIGSSILAFQASIQEGNRFLGGFSVSGALIDGFGRYVTKEGALHENSWVITCVRDFSMDFEWDEDSSAFYLNDAGTDEKKEQARQYYDIFICKPPPGNNFFCGYVAREINNGKPAYAQFFTHQSPPDFPEPAIEATFA